MAHYLRALRAEDGQSEPGKPIKFIASTEGIKRDGQDLKMENWRLDNYRANPVFLWSHDYRGNNLPIGRADVQVEGKTLTALVTFDPHDEFAQQVEGKYRNGFLHAVSVGWDNVSECPNCQHPLRASEWILKTYRVDCPNCQKPLPETIRMWHELLDVSAVNVPGDPQALIERTRNVQGAEGLTWEEAACLMARVFDPANQMTEAERRRAYNRAERLYRTFGRQAPELLDNVTLAALTPADLRGHFLEGEPDLFPGLLSDMRAGAVLNTRNLNKLTEAQALIGEVLKSAEKETADTPPAATEADNTEAGQAQQARVDAEMTAFFADLHQRFNKITGD